MPATCPVNRFAAVSEYPFNLLVQFVTVGKDQDARVWFILQNPFRQQHHDDAFAATLRVPDDSSLVGVDELLRLLNCDILMHTRQFFYSAIEKDKIVK